MLTHFPHLRPEVPRHLRALFVAAVLGLGVACAKPPALDPTLLRPVLERAVSVLRPLRPDAAARIEERARRAEEASAACAAAPWWRRSSRRADEAWLEAMTDAARCTTELARSQRELRTRWEVQAQYLEQEMERARSALRTPGMGQPEAAALRRAELLLGASRRAAAAGRLSEALGSAAAAADRLALIERRWLAEHTRFDDPERRARWQLMATEAVASSRRSGSRVIVVDKLARRLELFEAGLVVLSVPAELGANGLKRKRHAGDRATPEGRYRIVTKKEGAATIYHKALLIDYPNPEDLERFRAGRADGSVPPDTGPGSLIEIHGGGGSGRDWTDGCVALADSDMDRLFPLVAVGTPVVIVGTTGPPSDPGARP